MDKEERYIDRISLINLIQATLEQRASLPLQVKGCSMAPFIRDGDVLTLSPLSVDKPRLGDVIACRLPQFNKLVIHRVIKASKNYFLIKGDYCSAPDGLISKKDILGVVSRLDRNGNRINFGFGPAKVFIAFLSAQNILYPILNFLYRRLSNNCQRNPGYQSI